MIFYLNPVTIHPMSYIKSLFNKNFLEYASYVIRDRAIPQLEDGLKPVQRRILHTLFEMDDGKFHKVNNVVGQCMKYHPHGDASVGGALVVLANKSSFIDKQGNYGNLLTGDGAAASRYIECRIAPFAKDVFYNPDITEYVPSYDGRNKEPVVFRSKLPVVLIIGAEGIAVGMSTKILPHNIREVIEAEKAYLNGEKIKLYPDFPTGGEIDVSEYNDGNGKVLVRAKLDISDPKKIVIREIPFGCTTESIIQSVENAVKQGRIKSAEINDFTTSKAEIEIKLQRGVYAQDVVDSLYAFTECEQSISCNLLVIKDNLPVVMTVSEVIAHQAKQLVGIFKDELELELKRLFERLHLRTLERIFIEERIYKKIETMKTAEGVIKAVISGFEPFKSEIIREITTEDVDHLLKIPIRRISLYDINKNRQEVSEINARMKEVRHHLKHLKEYALAYLDGILEKLEPEQKIRHTGIAKFGKIDVKDAVKRDVPLRYDENTGYLGTAVSTGKEILSVSPYDRILVMRGSGVYTVLDVPDKLFVDKKLGYCNFSDKETLSKVLFTIVFKDGKTGFPYIKRCRIEQFIMNRDYQIVPEGGEVLLITTKEKGLITLHYEPKARTKIQEENFKIQDYEEKGLKTLGIKLSGRVALSAEMSPAVGKTAKEGSAKAGTVKGSSAVKTAGTASKPLTGAKTAAAGNPAGKSVTGEKPAVKTLVKKQTSQISDKKELPAKTGVKPLSGEKIPAGKVASGDKNTGSKDKKSTGPKKSPEPGKK